MREASARFAKKATNRQPYPKRVRLKAQVWTSCVGQLLSLSPQAGELCQHLETALLKQKLDH